MGESMRQRRRIASRARRGCRARWRDWIALLKPRVMTLVVFTGAIGLLLAPGPSASGAGVRRRCCASRSRAGAAGAINMWYERDIDALMRRTAPPADPGRPHRAGRRARLRRDAGGRLGAGDGAGDQPRAPPSCWRSRSRFYVFVYTIWLKRRTPQNIVIGGAAGAFPPVIGWAAVTGQYRRACRCCCSLIVFFWTPPHFWALSLYACEDYGRAGVPMLPVVRGRARDPAADPALHAAARRRLAAALGARLRGRGLRRRGRRARRWVSACCRWRVLRDRQDATGAA